MPCNCILDKPTYPQNEEWGPLVWWILHTLAEKAGKQSNPITMGDEMRAWPLFVKTLVAVIPCPYCKEHFQDYLQTHPFSLPPDYYEWKTYIPRYFYDFHEAVNVRLNKPSFPFSSLATTYANPIRLKDVLSSLEKVMERAIKMGGVSLLAYKAWLKQVSMLRGSIV